MKIAADANYNNPKGGTRIKEQSAKTWKKGVQNREA